MRFVFLLRERLSFGDLRALRGLAFRPAQRISASCRAHAGSYGLLNDADRLFDDDVRVIRIVERERREWGNRCKSGRRRYDVVIRRERLQSARAIE